MLRELLVQLALVCLALLLGATVYESVVMAPNYERDVPESLNIARQFLQRTTPAHFFRVMAPLTLIVLLIDVVACWSFAAARPWLITGFVAVAIGDALTFAFHYPRLAIMFRSPATDDANTIRKAAREWSAGNQVRAALLIVAFLSVLQGFARL